MLKLWGGDSKDTQHKQLNPFSSAQKGKDKKPKSSIAKGIRKLFKMLGLKGTLILLVVLFAAPVLIWFVSSLFQPPIFISSSQLTKVIAVNKLSAIEYPYEGVAEYTDGIYYERFPVHMHYKAIVTVSFNPADVQWNIDNEKKTITLILPEFTHSEPVIDDYIEYLEDWSMGIDPKKAFNYCKQDAIKEIADKVDLNNMAVENAHAMIEGLTYNLVKSGGYKLVWPEDMKQDEQKTAETTGDKNAA